MNINMQGEAMTLYRVVFDSWQVEGEDKTAIKGSDENNRVELIALPEGLALQEALACIELCDADPDEDRWYKSITEVADIWAYQEAECS